jgi:two-component system, NarL family, nitrate/nitrite response regulator NarL
MSTNLNEKPIRVVLADDHPLLNMGLAREIRDTEGLFLVAAVTNGRAALAHVRGDQPDVAVLDVDMPEMDGLTVLRAVVQEGLPTRVIILTGSVDESLVYNAISMGAAGYLVKTTGWPEIMDAIRRVAAGETVVDPTMAGVLAEALRTRGQGGDVVLSERERTVLTLTALDTTAKEIGDRLGLSERMVKRHLTSIYRKLGVKSKSQAVAEAVRRGMVR